MHHRSSQSDSQSVIGCNPSRGATLTIITENWRYAVYTPSRGGFNNALPVATTGSPGSLVNYSNGGLYVAATVDR